MPSDLRDVKTSSWGWKTRAREAASGSRTTLSLLGLQVLADELQRLGVRFIDELLVAAAQAVPGTANGHQFVRHLVLGELLLHVRRELIRHVGVLGTVNEHRRRVCGRHVPNRAI